MLTLKYLLVVAAGTPIALNIYLSTLLTYVLDYVYYLGEPPHPMYQFIVVGAGSGGCVVAGRLAEAGHSVLLVEAGGSSPSVAHIPFFVGFTQLSAIDWQYKTMEQKVGGRQSLWPRGKVLGGTSILNYMIYMRGHRGDYDEWSKLGVEGWNYEDVLPFFKKSENYVDDLSLNDMYHGRGGPLSVSNRSFADPITDIFVKSGAEKGYSEGDMNGDGQDGTFAFTPVSLAKGKREGAYKAFAEKQVGRTLRLMTQAHATKLIIEGDTVKGVQVRRFGRLENVYASGEVILSAGTIGTPQILMLSGIGDKDELEALGIESVLHSPQVGKNLQDHICALLPFNAPPEATSDIFAGFKIKNLLDYFIYGTGALTGAGGCGGNAFIHTHVNNDTIRPDIQIHFLGFSSNLDDGALFRRMVNLRPNEMDWLLKEAPGSTFTPTLSRPRSRGYIELASKDPYEHPVIQPNYLTEEEDLETLAAGLVFSHSLLDTAPFREVGATPYSPYPPCAHHKFGEMDYFKCYARDWSVTLYHPVGTAAMGTVLDSELRVKGLKGLRVADGSAIPKIMGGNTNAPIMMIGERAADFILKDKSREHTGDKEDSKVQAEIGSAKSEL